MEKHTSSSSQPLSLLAKDIFDSERLWQSLDWKFHSAITLRSYTEGPVAFSNASVYTSSTNPDGTIYALHMYSLPHPIRDGFMLSQHHLLLKAPYGVVFDYEPFESNSAVVVLWGKTLKSVLIPLSRNSYNLLYDRSAHYTVLSSTTFQTKEWKKLSCIFPETLPEESPSRIASTVVDKWVFTTLLYSDTTFHRSHATNLQDGHIVSVRFYVMLHLVNI